MKLDQHIHMECLLREQGTSYVGKFPVTLYVPTYEEIKIGVEAIRADIDKHIIEELTNGRNAETE